MRFDLALPVGVPPERAVSAYGAPSFYEGTAGRSDISVRGVVDREDQGEVVVIRVRFAFTGSVSSAVRAVVDPAKMTWVTRTEIVPAAAHSDLGGAARPLPGPAERPRHVPLRRGRARARQHGRAR